MARRLCRHGRAAALCLLLGYLWASPNTLLGVLAGLPLWCCGGQVRLVGGVIECAGRPSGGRFARLLAACGFGAITFGHVVLAIDPSTLARLRRHERVHVHQYERWGPLFLPAYLLSSLWQLVCGRRAYRDNYFERQAYAIDRQDKEAMAAADIDGADQRG